MEDKTYTKYLLEVDHLKKYFPLDTNFFGKTSTYLKAVDDVSFKLQQGKTLGIVGESGCGKTTMGRTILKLYEITGGNAYFHGHSLQEFAPKYVIKGIKKLPSYKASVLSLTAKIERLELELKKLEKSTDKELVEKIKLAQTEKEKLIRENEKVKTECIAIYKAFIVSSNIKEIKNSIFFDRKLDLLDKELAKIDEYEKEVEKISEQISKSSDGKEIKELRNRKISLENKVGNKKNKVVALRDYYANFLLENLDNKNITLDKYNTKGLIDYRLKYYENELKIKKCDDVICFNKEKSKIQAIKNKLEAIYLESAQITGAFILGDDVQTAKNALLAHSQYKKQYQKLSAKLAHYKEKLEKDNKYEAKINDINVQLTDLEEKLAHYKDLIKQGKEKLKNHPLFEQLESKRASGINLNKISVHEMNKLRTEMQLIFQDPYSSLPPRMPVGEIIAEGVKVHKIVPKDKIRDHVRTIMKQCGLQEHYYDRYPHEFSGGQRQRICIARALAVNPKLVVCDEPVSALDVSIQAQIINLLKKLQNEMNLTYLFISHDLSVVKYISDDIGVMYLGSMVEMGDKKKIFANPMHPYTQALFSAVPVPDPNHKMNRIILKGDIPSPANPPKGCKFHTRCIKCQEICKKVAPVFKEYEEGHFVACHLYPQGDVNE